MDEGYYSPSFLKVGARLVNRSFVTEAVSLVDGHTFRVYFCGSYSTDFRGRDAQALRHYFSSGAVDVLVALDCHEGKHVYADEKAIVCENCRQWIMEREVALRGTPPDTDGIPF